MKEQNLSHLSVIMVVSYYLPRRTLYFAGRIIAADTDQHRPDIHVFASQGIEP